jgi:hypothetical protein
VRSPNDRLFLLPGVFGAVFYLVPSFHSAGWVLVAGAVGLAVGLIWQVGNRRDISLRLTPWAVFVVVIHILAIPLWWFLPSWVLPTPVPAVPSYLLMVTAGVVLGERYLRRNEISWPESDIRGSFVPADSPWLVDESRNSSAAARATLIPPATHGDAADFINGKIDAAELVARLRRRNGLPDREDLAE